MRSALGVRNVTYVQGKDLLATIDYTLASGSAYPVEASSQRGAPPAHHFGFHCEDRHEEISASHQYSPDRLRSADYGENQPAIVVIVRTRVANCQAAHGWRA